MLTLTRYIHYARTHTHSLTNTSIFLISWTYRKQNEIKRENRSRSTWRKFHHTKRCERIKQILTLKDFFGSWNVQNFLPYFISVCHFRWLQPKNCHRFGRFVDGCRCSIYCKNMYITECTRRARNANTCVSRLCVTAHWYQPPYVRTQQQCS